MRLGGRLAAAIEVLEDIGRRHRPVADALKDWGLSHRFAGGGDRAAIGNIVYDALRHKRSAGWLLGEDTPRAIGFGALADRMGPDAQSLNDALDGDKFAPPLLSAASCRRWPSAALKTRRRRCGRTFPTGVNGCSNEPLAQSGSQKAQRLLPAHRSTSGSTRFSPTAPKCWWSSPTPAPRQPLWRYKAFASRRSTAMAGTRMCRRSRLPERLVRGPGRGLADRRRTRRGASRHAGARLLCRRRRQDAGAVGGDGHKGQVFAHDAEKARLAPIFDRIRRSENRNVQVVTKPAELAPLVSHMDIVLVDAPCTGSGTWRAPSRRQVAADAKTARCPQGRAVGDPRCRQGLRQTRWPLGLHHRSVFDEENGEQIAAFRERHEGFVPVDHRALWDVHFPGHAAAARIGKAGDISLSPALKQHRWVLFLRAAPAN